MFLHARKGHVEPLGKGCDRSVRTPELLQNAAPGSVRESAERGIEVGLAILYHPVQYSTCVTALQWEAERPLRCPSQLAGFDDGFAHGVEDDFSGVVQTEFLHEVG